MGNNYKILIATGIYPPDFRGPATILEALPGELRARGFEVKIVTYSDIAGSQQEREKDGVWRVQRGQAGWLRYARYFWLMWRLVAWADVVYATDIYSVGYFACLFKKIFGKKYIVRFAGDSAWEISLNRGWTQDYIVDFQQKQYEPRIEKLKERRRKILLGADKIIAVSNFMAGVAKRIGVAENRIAVIYNSIDFIKNSEIDLAAVERIKNQYGAGARLIVTACQLVLWKGVAGLIKILPELSQQLGGVNFLVLGEGQEMDNLKTLTSRIGLEQNVYFLGKIKRNEMMNYYKAADLFMLNTNYEGLSHTLLEVMKAGTPIVTTSIGGNPEVIENSKDGLLVAFNDEKGLSEAALKILNNKELADGLVTNAKEKLKEFSWQKTAEETARTLRTVINE